MGDDFFLQDSMLYGTDPWRMVLNTSPYLIAELLGILLLLIFMRRSRKAAVLGISALAFMFIVRFAWPFIFRAVEFQVLERATLDFKYLEFCMFHGWLIVLILEGIGLLLLTVSVFAWRTPPNHAMPVPAHSAARQTPAPPAAATPPSPTAPPTQMTASSLSVQPMSKGFFLGSLIAATMVSMLLSCGSLFVLGVLEEEGLPFAFGLSCISLLIVAYLIIVVSVFVYRIWFAIQGSGYERTTPGKAVGFLFIPFFNLYWLFVAYRGWAEDYNRLVHERGLGAPPMSMGLTTTMCVLMVISTVPYLGILPGLVNIVFVCIFINNAINGVNALARMAPDTA